jgi:hypothetical protein
MFPSDKIDVVAISKQDYTINASLCFIHQSSLESFIKPIRLWVLKASQFPGTMHDGAGVFYKPKL